MKSIYGILCISLFFSWQMHAASIIIKNESFRPAHIAIYKQDHPAGDLERVTHYYEIPKRKTMRLRVRIPKDGKHILVATRGWGAMKYDIEEYFFNKFFSAQKVVKGDSDRILLTLKEKKEY